MKGSPKTKKQLTDELNSLKRRITELEAAEAERPVTQGDSRLPQLILEKIVQILDSSLDSTFIHDVEGNLVYVNEAAARTLGYTKEELLKIKLGELNAGESAAAFNKHMKKVLDEGDAITEMEHRRKDGSVLPVEINTRMVEFQGNDVLFSAVRDIAGRKQTQEELIKSETRYRSLVETAGAGVASADVQGNLTFVNDTFCKMMGYLRDELVGKAFINFVHPDDVERIAQLFIEGLANPELEFHVEFRAVHKDGHSVWLYSSPTPVFYKSELVGGNAIIYDISERRRVEDELKEREARYSYLFEHSQVANALVGLDGRIIDVNESAAQLYGYDKSEIIGRNLLEFFPGESGDKAAEALATGLKGDYNAPAEYIVITKSGPRTFLFPGGYHVLLEGGKEVGFLISAVDITGRNEAMEILRQSEEKYRTILEETQDGYFEVDLAGNFTFVNDALCRQFGYSREELIGMNNRNVTAVQDIETVYKAFNQVYRSGKPIKDFTLTTVRKDGKNGLGEISVFPMRDDKGDIIGFRGIGRDVAGRLQMIEDLRRSEERYRTVLDEMEEAYYELDIAGNLTFFNDALIRKAGTPREELMGLGFKDYIPAQDVGRVFKAFNQVYKTGKPIKGIPLQAIRKDGSIMSSEESILPLKNKAGEVTGFRGVSHDVTERLQMMEALRRSEERYRTMLDEMEEAYYEVDLQGNFTFFSDALCRQLGYSRDEIMGMSYKTYIPPENGKKVFEVYNKVYQTGEPHKSFASSQIKKDGTRVYTEDSIFAMRDEGGKIIGFRGISRDVTERKRAEEERKQLEQKAQFSSRLASVGELASGVAHEINNPLTAVIGYAHLLLGRADIPADIRRDIEVINEGAQRVAGIIKKLLVFARQARPERTYVDVNEIINTTLELRAYSLQSHNIKVILQLDPDLPMTVADPGQLQQVFLNLIMNAETEVKSIHGGGKLAIKTERTGDTLRISFKDNGLGIAKENLERIFNPFFTTRKVGQGTGLGLSVCHGIVSEHKGKIWVESQLGKGATFVVELPIVEDKRQTDIPEPVVRETRKVNKARILVIDDETVIRQFVSQILAEEGHEVKAVESAEVALEEVDNKEYRAIILDIKMPGMSGIELYQRFNEISPLLADKVVFMTGDTMGAATMAFLSKTKAPYIIKPFDATQLKEEINRILSSS
jgi:PAS domain S-box-containing protein